MHKLRFTVNNAQATYIDAIDIITPIHSYKSNLYADFQNTLTVGSQSLMDTRATSAIKEALPAKKAWAQAVGFGGTISTNTNSYVPMPGLSVTIKTSGGPIEVMAVVDIYYPTPGKRAVIAIFVDGEKATVPSSPQAFTTAGEGHTTHVTAAIVPVAAGVHKVDVYWFSTDGTPVYSYMDATTNGRSLTVKEL